MYGLRYSRAWVIRAHMTVHRESWKHLAGFFLILDTTQFDVLPIVIQNLTMSYVYGRVYPDFNIKRIRTIYLKRVEINTARVLAWKRKKAQMLKKYQLKRQKMDEDAMDIDT